jgi:protein-S-isoprenylcysteine O-methyltransferase Ste14
MEIAKRFMTYLRILLVLCGVYLFIIYLPGLLVKGYSSIDILNVDEIMSRLTGWGLLSLFGLFGLILYLWTIFLQVIKGFGTPIPLVPPKKLLVGAPYSYCRNPMVLGAIMFYLGLCALIDSWDAFSIVAAVAVILLAYVKFWEEAELEARFGQAYTEYKNFTPFLIPKVFGRRWYFLFLR